MIHLMLTKILTGFLAVALVAAVFLFVFKVFKIIGSLFRFRLSFDDFISILWMLAVIIGCYYIGDFIK